MRLRDFKNLESVSQKGHGFLEGPKTMFLTETTICIYICMDVHHKSRNERSSSTKRHQSKLQRDSNNHQYPYLHVKSYDDVSAKPSKPFKPRNRRFSKSTPKCRNRNRAHIKGTIPSLENIPSEKLQDCVRTKFGAT